MSIIEKDFLTITQATQRLGVARSTLNRWVQQGKLPKYHLGGKVLFKPSDLDALLELDKASGAGKTQPEVTEPSEEELEEARAAYLEMVEERKAGVKAITNEDIVQLAAKILRESGLAPK